MKPHIRSLSSTDVSTLSNALRVAAEVYEGHAKEFAKVAADVREKPPQAVPEGDGASFDLMPQNPIAFDRMAEQFTRQAEDARAMMDELQGPKGMDDYMGEVDIRITYTPDEDDARQGPWARP